jgi:cullin 4
MVTPYAIQDCSGSKAHEAEQIPEPPSLEAEIKPALDPIVLSLFRRYRKLPTTSRHLISGYGVSSLHFPFGSKEYDISMPNTEASSSLHVPGNSSASTKKRKRAAGQSSPKQSTISELFSQKVSNSKVGTSRTNPKVSSSGQKHHKSEPSPLVRSTPHRAESMYNFSSSKPNNIIDLTDGSSPSPRRNLVKQALVGPQVGARRITIKNLKTSKVNTEKYYDQIVGKLDLALASILGNDKQLPVSMEELYRGVENICKQGRAAELYTRLKSRMELWVDSVTSGLFTRISTDTSSVEALKLVLAQWNIWKSQWTRIRAIFYYMNQTHLLSSTLPSLQELSIELFLSYVLQDGLLKEKTLDGVCESISFDRTGESFDVDICRSAIAMFNELGIYTRLFEPLVLERSQSFASEWANKTSGAETLPNYVQRSLDLIDSEMNRCGAVGLATTTKRALLVVLEEHLIKQQKERLIDIDDVAGLFNANAIQGLEKLYSLLGRCKLSDTLKPALETWIRTTGTGIVLTGKNSSPEAKKLHEDQMVVKLLTLKKQVDNIWIVSFHRNSELMHALRLAFELFINKTEKGEPTHGTDNSKAGEMIAKYVNMLLRGGSKVIPAALTKSMAITTAPDEDDNEDHDEESEVNDQLDQVLDLFRFLHGKAVFEAFYKNDLAKRLLTGRSASADAELSMLARLKNECGPGFTQNLEKMFKDIELSREEMAGFKARQAEVGRTQGLDLFVNVLSSSAWPTYPDIAVNIPAIVKQAIEKFENSYQAHHSGRRLTWKHKLANCLLRANFPRGNKELVASGFQGIVLLLFSNIRQDEKISYQQIKAETGLRKYNLRRCDAKTLTSRTSRRRAKVHASRTCLREDPAPKKIPG